MSSFRFLKKEELVVMDILLIKGIDAAFKYYKKLHPECSDDFIFDMLGFYKVYNFKRESITLHKDDSEIQQLF